MPGSRVLNNSEIYASNWPILGSGRLWGERKVAKLCGQQLSFFAVVATVVCKSHSPFNGWYYHSVGAVYRAPQTLPHDRHSVQRPAQAQCGTTIPGAATAGGTSERA